MADDAARRQPDEPRDDMFWPHEDDSLEAHIYEIRHGRNEDYVRAHFQEAVELFELTADGEGSQPLQGESAEAGVEPAVSSEVSGEPKGQAESHQRTTQLAPTLLESVAPPGADLRAALLELITMWRTERNELNAAAANNADLIAQAAWCGQALGRSDCAERLAALLDAPPPRIR